VKAELCASPPRWTAPAESANQAERELRDGPLTPEEAELLIVKAARKGSVPALQLWYEGQGADDPLRRSQDARRLLAGGFGDNDGR
jgi:hypothetical protein